MSSHIYSAETDALYPLSIVSSYKDVPKDVIESILNEANLPDGWHYLSDADVAMKLGNVNIHESKQIKPNKYPFELEDIPESTESELSQLSQSEMITELNWCDLQIKLHASSDRRSVSTIDDIYAYARACRDYVQNIDGELIIMTDKPVRPT